MILLEEPLGPFESVFPGWHQTMQQQQEPVEVLPPRRKYKRRPGACEPCRSRKLKCDGTNPCNQCTKRLRRDDVPRCSYVNYRRNKKHDTDLFGSQPESDSSADSREEQHDGSSYKGPPNILTEGVPYGVYSLARCIDLFKALAGTDQPPQESNIVGHVSGIDAFDNFQEHGMEDLMTVKATADDNIYSGYPDFLIAEEDFEAMSPDLATIYNDILAIRGLIRLGSLVKAWLRVTRLVKVTETICGMGRRYSKTKTAIDPRQAQLRCRIWWLVLELEVQISTHIGQPLNVSTRFLDGIDRPNLDDLEEGIKRLENSRLDVRQAQLDVLSKISDELNADGAEEDYDTLEDLINFRRFREMQSRVPQIDSAKHAIAVADHRIEFFSFKMLLACILASAWKRKHPTSTYADTVDSAAKQGKIRAKFGKLLLRQKYEHQKDIVGSAVEIVNAFAVINQIEEARDTRNWPRVFAAYTASSILAMAVLRGETGVDAHLQSVTQMEAIFVKLSKDNPACHFAAKAAKRLASLVAEMKKLKPQFEAPKAPEVREKVKLPPLKKGVDTLTAKKDGLSSEMEPPRKKRKSSMSEEVQPDERKRPRVRTKRSPKKIQSPESNLSPLQPKYDSLPSQTMHQLMASSQQTAWQADTPVYHGPYPLVNFPPDYTLQSTPDGAYTRYDSREFYPAYYWYPPLSNPILSDQYASAMYHNGHYGMSAEHMHMNFHDPAQHNNSSFEHDPDVGGDIQEDESAYMDSNWIYRTPGSRTVQSLESSSTSQHMNSTPRPSMMRHNSVPDALAQLTHLPSNSTGPASMPASTPMQRISSLGHSNTLQYPTSRLHNLPTNHFEADVAQWEDGTLPTTQSWNASQSAYPYAVGHAFQSYQDDAPRDAT